MLPQLLQLARQTKRASESDRGTNLRAGVWSKAMRPKWRADIEVTEAIGRTNRVSR